MAQSIRNVKHIGPMIVGEVAQIAIKALGGFNPDGSSHGMRQITDLLTEQSTPESHDAQHSDDQPWALGTIL